MQGWVVNYDGFENLCCLSFYLSLSLSLSLTHTHTHTLFSQRCCAVSHAVKVPFPSIFGRLQRSVIREINGTGPISCLVPFESAKLLRTSKKMSQFILDLLSSLCKMSNTYNQAQVSPHKTQIYTFTHTYIHIKADQLFGSRETVQVWHQTWLEWIHGLNS